MHTNFRPCVEAFIDDGDYGAKTSSTSHSNNCSETTQNDSDADIDEDPSLNDR